MRVSAAPGSPSGVRTVTVTSHGWPPVAAQNTSRTSFADASRCSAPLKNTTTCGCAGCRWWRPPCLGRPSAHERTATSCAWQLLAWLTAHCSAARPDGESSMPTMMRRSLALLMDGTSLHYQPHPGPPPAAGAMRPGARGPSSWPSGTVGPAPEARCRDGLAIARRLRRRYPWSGLAGPWSRSRGPFDSGFLRRLRAAMESEGK
jgi:hypothetical protein